MSKFVFVLGGARSGKSRYAVELAKRLSQKVAYIATCSNPDAEMKKRIGLHKDSRPCHWKVIEEGKDIRGVFDRLKNKYAVVIVDCLGLLVTNLLAQNKDRQILKNLEQLARCISKSKNTTIVVSNEVGGGIVPENALARRFRDLLGLGNQMMAKTADEVILMQSGIALKIKG
jgi:adenosylcobinamide kinase/adenosylcobinamide-phosphate guanylyltransferase